MAIEFSQQHSKVDRSKIPVEVVYHRMSQKLELIYANEVQPPQKSAGLPSEYLRVFSPSAEVRGHTPDQATLQHGKRNISITGIEHQGSYAIKLIFEDGHNTGIYTWNYLWELAARYEENWENYLAQLEQAGKSR
ncbi:DUF971 domain-containing protein [Litoribacillus peritrichatus]|uniref:DUF971 domain-containing protein n=1 Tax=Litoribacillus peritrichatus TaxID=718191 RepID=A0ABP7MB97_9GAMM